jgi:hypothetical protein
MTVTFRAFHGTLAKHVPSIRRDGVRPSSSEDEWLGHGAYYFTDGLAEPNRSAAEWAACVLWSHRHRAFLSDQIAVVEMEISAPRDKVLDLRDAAKARAYHDARRQWISASAPTLREPVERPMERTYDAEFMNWLKANDDISLIIGNFHIQLRPEERYFRVDSRIPSVSVLCASPQRDVSVATRLIAVDFGDSHPLPSP